MPTLDDFATIKLGSTDIQSICLGSEQLWPSSSIKYYLTFTSTGTNSIGLVKAGTFDKSVTLYYSYNAKKWEAWDLSGKTFSSGHPIYIAGMCSEGFANDTTRYYHFNFSGSDNVSCSGDLMSLINCEESTSTIPAVNCFYGLFSHCTNLVSGPSLSATVLKQGCYSSLFYDTGLTSAPALPAETLAESCYKAMFRSCASLVLPPALPATTLAPTCYQNMFMGCSSLASAPILPATTLTNYCYGGMFYECTSLTAAPALPATTLAPYCYDSMFFKCRSLTTASSLEATTLAQNCYNSMFRNCENLISAPALPATSLADSCYNSMFNGCKKLVSAPDLLATTLVYGCYQGMFSNCKSLSSVKCLATNLTQSSAISTWLNSVASSGTFTKASGVEWPSGGSGIPNGWTVLEE